MNRRSADLVRTVKLMSEVKCETMAALSGRWKSRLMFPPCTEFQRRAGPNTSQARGDRSFDRRSPGAADNSGGLPRDFAVPVLIVQHIAPGFTQGFVDWLAQSSSLPVHIPAHGQPVLPGHVYVAPDGLHMAVSARGRDPPQHRRTREWFASIGFAICFVLSPMRMARGLSACCSPEWARTARGS